MLGAGPAVELQVLVDLRLAPGHRRLVEGELHLAGTAGDHLAHQRRVVGGDVVADELGHVGEAHDPAVEVHPLVHVAQLDVADHVVDGLEQPPGLVGAARHDRVAADEPGQEGAVVPGPVDQRVPGVAVRADRGDPDRPVPVGQVVRRVEADRAVPDRVPVRGVDIGYLQCDVPDPVPVLRVVLRVSIK